MLPQDLTYIIDAHANHARKPSKAFRKFDGKTPYSIHPIWCATMIAAEYRLAEVTRNEGTLVLLYHDILEDTTRPLPEHLTPRVKELINHMTFPGGSKQEMEDIWQKPLEVKLYKLYDKTNNLFNLPATFSDEKLARYKEYARKLADEVKPHYEGLHIYAILDAVTQ